MPTSIDMKSVGELSNWKFSIPNYQRGYRWTKQQVKELLDDIWEFSNAEKEKSNIYCLQPLVVCEKKRDTNALVNDIKSKDSWSDICEFVKNNIGEQSITWEVIDGQQRLTSISIVLQVLGAKDGLYSISYDTLVDHDDKINNIQNLDDTDAEDDINFHFMKIAKETTINWLKTICENEEEKNEVKEKMVETIRERVKFIWYKTDEEKPISVFTRLNVGRISLTSSELIKALFLNRENFGGQLNDVVRAKQMEIAQEWDRIENQLQDDEFWLFLRNLDESWEKPTRIDFLLDFLCKPTVIQKMNEVYGLQYYLPVDSKIVGNDSYHLFRTYYECYKQQKNDFIRLWRFIKEIFDIWAEWYTNSKLFHYVGYVLTTKASTLEQLVSNWIVKTNTDFLSFLVDSISEYLKKRKCHDLNRNYKEESGDHKRDSIPLLLLHNVETIVRQNEVLTNNKDYQLGVFYKFPFHLYKIEHWDVEHVDSSTQNDLKNEEDQKNWILSAYQCVREMNSDENGNIKESVKEYFNEMEEMISAFFKDEDNEDNSTQFGDIYNSLNSLLNGREAVPSGSEQTATTSNESNNADWKNRVQNYVLLDRSTNRDYKNAVFPDKRSHIVGKEKGKRKVAYWTPENKIDYQEETFKSAFVPICTKNVFQKTYSVMQGDPTKWDESDAEAYKKDLFNTLKEFGVYEK